MPLTKTPHNSIFPVWETEMEHEPHRFERLPTPEFLKATALFGIPLKSALTGQTISDEALQVFINQAISEIEHTLDLYITPVVFFEKHDYMAHNFTWNYNYLKLNHPNVINVTKVELSFTNNTNNNRGFVNFPMEHVHVMPQEGVIQLVPAFGTSLSGFLLSAFSGTQYHALRAIGITNFPGAVRVEYTAGFEKHRVPALLVALIANKAAYMLLSIMGPLIFPYSSTSQSIDGTSQGVSTMGPLFLRLRMEELEKIINTEMEAAKGYYQRRWLVDYF
jgi:hypothetical protein